MREENRKKGNNYGNENDSKRDHQMNHLDNFSNPYVF